MRVVTVRRHNSDSTSCRLFIIWYMYYYICLYEGKTNEENFNLYENYSRQYES